MSKGMRSRLTGLICPPGHEQQTSCVSLSGGNLLESRRACRQVSFLIYGCTGQIERQLALSFSTHCRLMSISAMSAIIRLEEDDLLEGD